MCMRLSDVVLFLKQVLRDLRSYQVDNDDMLRIGISIVSP